MDTGEPSLEHLFPVPCCSKGLTNAEISRLEAINLAHSDFHNYFEFDRDFSKVDSKLCPLFTGLFSYFNNDCPKVCSYNT